MGKLESIAHAEGRRYNTNVNTASTTEALRIEYAIRDHLGNTRIMFTDKNNNGVIDVYKAELDNEIILENHYYAFGMTFGGNVWINDSGDIDHRYQYNGKELNNDHGLGWYNYGARFYDAVLGRFTGVDALADFAPDWTPYRYGFDSPIIYVDPDGLFEDRAEAKDFKKEHGIKGRIKKDGDSYYVEGRGANKGEQYAYGTHSGGFGSSFSTSNPSGAPSTIREYAPDPMGINYATGIFGDWRTYSRNSNGEYEMTRDYLSVRSANAVVQAASFLPVGSVGRGVGVAAKGGSWAKTSGILRDAVKGKGNYGLGSGTYDEAMQAGRSWVGEGFTISKDGSSWISSNGLRQFRPPSFKPKLNIEQANFQWRNVNKGAWQSNGHLDIIKP